MTGLSIVTLRHYEKEQLLLQIARTSQKYRQYSDSDIEWIKMLQCMRRANIPIQSIKDYKTVDGEIMKVPQEFFVTTIKEVPDKNFGIAGKTIDKVKAEYMQKNK